MNCHQKKKKLIDFTTMLQHLRLTFPAGDIWQMDSGHFPVLWIKKITEGGRGGGGRNSKNFFFFYFLFSVSLKIALGLRMEIYNIISLQRNTFLEFWTFYDHCYLFCFVIWKGACGHILIYYLKEKNSIRKINFFKKGKLLFFVLFHYIKWHIQWKTDPIYFIRQVKRYL